MLGRVRTLQRYFGTTAQAEFDLIVIGAGSGGLACSKAAANLGVKVALVDAVAPSPHGTKWGIGGTCANVGCIPKKLMHQAALVGKELENAASYGWNWVEKGQKHDWKTLVRVVNDRIKANNWVYRVDLNEKGVKYYNAFATFVDSTTVRTVADTRKRTETLLRAPKIVVATGLRPRYPQIPGTELGITSDDVFTLTDPPGRTLVVGGSYVALETAGFLKGLGYPVDLLIRSRPLKEFDQDCVTLVMKSLAEHGVNVLPPSEVQSVEKHQEVQRMVHFGNSSMSKEIYDTVVWAIGRDPSHYELNLDKAGIKTGSSGRILVDDRDVTTTKNIFAIGDIADGRPELTPTAILSGQLLASRIFGQSEKLMDYRNVATTVFTSLELGTVGMTEEDAIRHYGAKKVEVYHSYFTPFEYIVPQHQDSENCYAKVICLRSVPRTVLGMHVVGPNAAEIIQGYAVAMRTGLTFDQLTETVAIHPCSSEEFIKMSVSKRSGGNPRGRGCCG